MKRMSDKTRKIIFWTMFGVSLLALIAAFVIGLVGIKQGNSSVIRISIIIIPCDLLLNVLNVFVQKPFIVRAPDSARDESLRFPWRSGELFSCYHDWLFHTCKEEVFDCMSGGTPHKHCMDSLIAQKLGEGEIL